MRLEYFQLIDRIVDLDLRNRTIRTQASVPVSSTIFEGHFPGFPLMPGVLLMESMAQTSGWLIIGLTGFTRMPFLAAFNEAKLRAFVKPGDALEITAALIHDGSGFARTKAEIRHDHSFFRSGGPAGIGVVFTNRNLATTKGTHHIPGFVGINDSAARFPPPGGGIPNRRVILQLLWYLEARENDPSAFRFSMWVAQDGTVFHKDDGPCHWREVQIDVEPGKITAQVGHAPGQMGPLTPYAYRQFPRTLQQEVPEVRSLDLGPIDQRMIGILVSGGQCTVRRLRVIPQSRSTP